MCTDFLNKNCEQSSVAGERRYFARRAATNPGQLNGGAVQAARSNGHTAASNTTNCAIAPCHLLEAAVSRSRSAVGNAAGDDRDKYIKAPPRS